MVAIVELSEQISVDQPNLNIELNGATIDILTGVHSLYMEKASEIGELISQANTR